MKTHTQLDSFTRAYIEAALWSSTDDNGAPLDASYSADDLSESALERIAADCAKFKAENEIPDYSNGEWTTDQRAGHDFWLSRCGHGSGFFDRDELPGDVRDALHDASEAFGTCDLYVGDDGKLYVA